MTNEEHNIAVVVKQAGSHYSLSCLPEWNPFQAVLRGKMRLAVEESTNPVAVGDLVEYVIKRGNIFSNDDECIITKVLPRKNCIVRKASNLSKQSQVIAANIDMAFLVFTVAYPEVKRQFIDRFLVSSEAYGVPVTLIINKLDLYGDDELEIVEKYRRIYGSIGYDVMAISAKNIETATILREKCKNKVVLFSGQSGVGKSSIIMSIDPELKLKIQEISVSHEQGKHTTTFYQMHPIASGGFVIDSPGVRGFGLFDFSHEELSNYFPEMLKVESNCKFVPCTHTHEPGCAVKEGVLKGTISMERYESYLGMLKENKKYR